MVNIYYEEMFSAQYLFYWKARLIWKLSSFEIFLLEDPESRLMIWKMKFNFYLSNLWTFECIGFVMSLYLVKCVNNMTLFFLIT